MLFLAVRIVSAGCFPPPLGICNLTGLWLTPSRNSAINVFKMGKKV